MSYKRRQRRRLSDKDPSLSVFFGEGETLTASEEIASSLNWPISLINFSSNWAFSYKEKKKKRLFVSKEQKS